MGGLQKLLADVYARLRDVSASQKIALLLGGALVAVSLMWLVYWAATPEMVPLLPQDLTAEDLATVRAGLEGLNQRFEVRGNRLYIQASANRPAILAQLQMAEHLPADTSVGFAALIASDSPWTAPSERDRRWTYALQEELSRVLRQFQGVRQAKVFLNLDTQKRTYSRTAPPNSASVALTMRHNAEVPRSLGIAAAQLVSGAVAGLPVRRVDVIDASSGRPVLDWESEQEISTQLDRKLTQEEQRYVRSIRNILGDPNALVSVQVELDPTSTTTESQDPTKSVTESEQRTTETTTRGRVAEEPGVRANTQLAAGGGGIDESHQKETSESTNVVGMTRRSESKPPGGVERVTAAISLSHGYLASVFQRRFPTAEAPTDEDIEKVFQQERARLIGQIVQLVKPHTEENVSLAWYYDFQSEPAQADAPGALDEAMSLAKRYGPQSALAMLAVVSLGLMLRMAKRVDSGEAFGLELGLSRDAIEAARRAASDVSSVAHLHAGVGPAAGRGRSDPGRGAATAAVVPDALVDQAAVAEGVLVAQEVDEGTVQTRKMLEQVSQMAAKDPEMVSALVEHWMQRSEQFPEE